MWDYKHEGFKLLCSLNRHNLGWLSVMECRERFQLCLLGFWVHSVRAQILKLHHDNIVIKPCNDCGSPQGPVTLRTRWDACDHEKFTTCNAYRWH
ncbi:F-box protein [Pyrus ussuriensis x Pyrus communis]|uniref:F-box protein n=1 Tax=Pyrus ussuriensis x Pyrus communis TaxID=2448454 RepID=A0A5N5F7Q6_9ROSA|nr:F-box protein [Pyrus ussuriensis x Pyrus communis]